MFECLSAAKRLAKAKLELRTCKSSLGTLQDEVQYLVKEKGRLLEENANLTDALEVTSDDLKTLESAYEDFERRFKRIRQDFDRLKEVMAKGDFPERILFEPAGKITQEWVDFARNQITRSGMGWILDLEAGPQKYCVEAIRCIPGTEFPQYGYAANAIGGVWEHDIILNCDTLWFPSQDLPGSILHEAWHHWWRYAIGAGDHRCRELGAYMVQQLYELHPQITVNRTLFKDRPGAKDLV